MTKQDERDRHEFVSKIFSELDACEPTAPYRAEVRPLSQELMRLARRHGKLAERLCNDSSYGPREERADANLERRMGEIIREPDLAPAIVGIKFSSDPRGFTVKVFLRSGDYNTWGGKEDGWGVPQ